MIKEILNSRPQGSVMDLTPHNPNFQDMVGHVKGFIALWHCVVPRTAYKEIPDAGTILDWLASANFNNSELGFCLAITARNMERKIAKGVPLGPNAGPRYMTDLVHARRSRAEQAKTKQ